jgi:hypothetical protein
MDHIIIGPVAYPLTALQNMLGEGIVEKPFQIITALPTVRVVSKERGNFYSVVLERLAIAKQLVDFMILMEKFYIPVEVSVTATQL